MADRSTGCLLVATAGFTLAIVRGAICPVRRTKDKGRRRSLLDIACVYKKRRRGGCNYPAAIHVLTCGKGCPNVGAPRGGRGARLDTSLRARKKGRHRGHRPHRHSYPPNRCPDLPRTHTKNVTKNRNIPSQYDENNDYIIMFYQKINYFYRRIRSIKIFLLFR